VSRIGLTGPERVFRAAGAGLGRPAVGASEDLERILALPKRPMPSAEEIEALVEKWTTKLQRHSVPCDCKIKRLFPVQAWYFEEASRCQGVLGHIVVGGGKTGIDILLPMVVPGTKVAVVLIPPALRAQFYNDIKEWAKHFVVPNLAGDYGPFHVKLPVLHVLAYSSLSVARFATVLKAKQPDMIIADEAQHLKDKKATRTGRFLRYFAENLETKFYAHSGSLTTRSLSDYGHLATLSLRDGSPLPLDPATLQEWCGALDPTNTFPAPVGSLRRLCTPEQTARQGFRERLLATPGVVVTEDAKLPVKLILHERALAVSEVVREALAKIRSTATRPDGEELVEAIEVAACLRQMAAGCYYFWRYPRGEAQEVIETWFRRRGAWHCLLRERLKRPSDHADSPLLLALAAERSLEGARHKADAPIWREGAEAWAAWKEVRETVKPETSAKFVDDFMVKDAVAWGREAPGIIWHEHTALGHLIAKVGGFPYYGGGAEASSEILHETGDRTIVCSIAAHGTGKNLQAFNRNLITTFPANDGIFEQLAGRTHRTGQTKDVTVDYYAHTMEEKEAFVTAMKHAQYVFETTGGLHKMLYAERGTP
jgi:hypothetical protein